MFDGLVEILMGWLHQAFCYVLQELVLLATGMMQIVSTLLPSVAVPSWFTSYSWPSQAVAFVAWVFPTHMVGWMVLAWLAFELSSFLVLVFYRAFMDLL